MAEDFCPQGVCDGSGWLLGDDGYARACTCRPEKINRRIGRRLGTGIPLRYRNLSFERRPICDLDPALLREVRRYLRDIDHNLAEGRGLWFHGDVGTGKTSLAMLISKQAAEAGHSVAIYSVPRLLAEIKETFEEGAGFSYMQLFQRLCQVELLQLDDLGAERRTEWVLEQLYSIVNERWQNRRAIVVTTNTAPSASDALEGREGPAPDDLARLREQVGHRTVSRLLEICPLGPIPLMGPDLRLTSPS